MLPVAQGATSRALNAFLESNRHSAWRMLESNNMNLQTVELSKVQAMRSHVPCCKLIHAIVTLWPHLCAVLHGGSALYLLNNTVNYSSSVSLFRSRISEASIKAAVSCECQNHFQVLYFMNSKMFSLFLCIFMYYLYEKYYKPITILITNINYI